MGRRNDMKEVGGGGERWGSKRETGEGRRK